MLAPIDEQNEEQTGNYQMDLLPETSHLLVLKRAASKEKSSLERTPSSVEDAESFWSGADTVSTGTAPETHSFPKLLDEDLPVVLAGCRLACVSGRCVVSTEDLLGLDCWYSSDRSSF